MTKVGFDREKMITYYRGKYSVEEASYINQAFCDEHQEKDIKALLSSQFDELMAEDDMQKKNLDHILYRIHYEINTNSATQKVRTFDRIIKWTLRIAGVLVLPLMVFIGIYLNKEIQLKQDTWVEIKSPAWTRAQFSLPDGTTGWLNSNSSIKYNENFINDRKVTLNGEAFFDVTKDKRRPFLVSTNHISVKVLGTRFNITSYENEKNVEVVLEEGKLIFTNTLNKKSYVMKPNDLITYNKTRNDFTTEVVQPHKYLSWTEGMLVFRNDPLDAIARKLERWYNIDVEIRGNFADVLRLRATFSDESLEQVLILLKRSLPIDYKIENQEIKSNDTYTKKKVLIIPRTR